jgi:hypothetical protein|tara:strand:+ start:853 stop:1260 length:408 start_codon:yes stop_codon:yes gene_type:complete
MGEEFHAVIKLVTGEEIFSLVCVDENDGDPIILLMNPVIMKVMRNHVGQFVKVKPWIQMSDDSMYVIKYDKIITMTEVTEKKMITFYNKYLNEEDCDWDEDGKTKISDKMGYITTVDAARKMLENLYNSKDSKES